MPGPVDPNAHLALIPAGAGKVRVLIATTLGPVDVLMLTPEDPVIGRSVACIGGTTKTADIDADYQAFVDRSTGVIERLFGPGCYRIDLSDRIDAGSSWQLGILAAHALFAAGRLAREDESAEFILWATGSVRAVDLTVGQVGHVAEKLAHSLQRLNSEAAAGRKVIVALPAANADDISEDVAAAFASSGIATKSLTMVQGLPAVTAAGSSIPGQLASTESPALVHPTPIVLTSSGTPAHDAFPIPGLTSGRADRLRGAPRAGVDRRLIAGGMAAMFAIGLNGKELVGFVDRGIMAAQMPFESSRTPPLPAPMVAAVRQEIEVAKVMLRRIAVQKMIESPPNHENNMWAWAIAQMMAAAPPQQPDEQAAYLDYMEKTLNQSCGCYIVGRIKHSTTSAWALISYARMGQAPPKAALSGVLAQQKPSGWWSAALDATDDERNASLYVTSLMVIALRALSNSSAVDSEQAAVVAKALKRGVDWIAQQHPNASGEWADYPKNERSSSNIIFGAMTLVALEGPEIELTRRSTSDVIWRSYRGLPQSHVFFPSDVMVLRTGDEGYIDTYRHVPYPWVAYALTTMYDNRSFWDRVRIARDLQGALLVNLQSPAFRKQEWLLSEHVFVMERLLARLDSQNTAKARVRKQAAN